MKKLLLTAALILALGAAFGQKIENGCILAIYEGSYFLQPDVTINQFIAFEQSKMIPAVEKAYPGLRSFLLSGDRGEFAHQISFVNYIPSETLRNKYWPTENGSSPYVEAANKILKPVMQEYNTLVAGNKGTYTDWVVLPVNTSAPAPLTKGVVLGTHLLTIDLDPDVTMNKYLNFLTKKYIPEMEKAYPGWRFFMLRGDRGDFKNRYMFLIWIESVETRDKFMTEDGYTDAGKAAMEKLQPLMEESNKLATWSSVFTDWIIL